CMDKGTNVSAGIACGQDRVCNESGACVSCAAGSTCAVAGKPCRTGTTACNTGKAVCVESGNAPSGTSCGTGMVCSGGTCVAWKAGLECTPANPCHAGMTACSPDITCGDTSSAVADGTSCGADKVCSHEACVSCKAGSPCQASNACKTGQTSCGTGVSV